MTDGVQRCRAEKIGTLVLGTRRRSADEQSHQGRTLWHRKGLCLDVVARAVRAADTDTAELPGTVERIMRRALDELGRVRAHSARPAAEVRELPESVRRRLVETAGKASHEAAAARQMVVR